MIFFKQNSYGAGAVYMTHTIMLYRFTTLKYHLNSLKTIDKSSTDHHQIMKMQLKTNKK